MLFLLCLPLLPAPLHPARTPLPPALLLRHVPHDPVFSVATAPRPGGGLEILILSDESIPLRTTNDGLSWETLSGAGLGAAISRDLVFHPGLAASGGQGLFLIGTDSGVFSYDPATEEVASFSNGIPANDRKVFDLDAPLQGSDGPAVLVTSKGNVYLFSPSGSAWVSVLNLGTQIAKTRTAVAVSPHFDSTQPTGPFRTLALALDDLLYLSNDGGTHWTIHSQFSVPVQDSSDWLIYSFSFAEDYATSGIMLLGRGKPNPVPGGSEEIGEIWRSADFGQTFQRVRTLETSVAVLAASPPGPSGKRKFFAGGFHYPGTHGYVGTGILVSDDLGQNWADLGNFQDFLEEPEPGNPSGEQSLSKERHLVVSASYSTDGMVLFGILEGLFQSKDEGAHWFQRQTRPQTDVRALAAGIGADGQAKVFGGLYGSGTVLFNETLLQTSILEDGEMPYLKTLAASPNFSGDGTLLVGGATNLFLWFDPAAGGQNPFGATGWVAPPLKNLSTGSRMSGYPRALAISPHFDNRGLPGTDRTFFWNTFFGPPRRSEDGGFTAASMSAVQGGGTAPRMYSMAVAPTYDASWTATKSDLFGSSGDGQVWRLQADKWLRIKKFPTRANRILVDPSWSRPDNPRIFLGFLGKPGAAMLLDRPSGPVGRTYGKGLEGKIVMDMAIAPDFSSRPVLYAATLTRGIFRLDLSPGDMKISGRNLGMEVSSRGPSWEPVGGPFPPLWSKAVLTSPVEGNRFLYAGTKDGLYRALDAPGSTWEPVLSFTRRDNKDVGFTFFSPADPSNPDPARPWAWKKFGRAALPATVSINGDSVAYTPFDGSFLVANGNAARIRVNTFSGPGAGTMTLTVSDYFTGAVLGSSSEDLALASTKVQNHFLEVDLGAEQPVHVRVEIRLDPGETVAFDSMDFGN